MQIEFLEQFARIGKALSSPSRLHLLDLLCQGEKSVEVLVAQSDLTLKNVSAQLRVLKEAGLLRSHKDGKHVYYSISDEQVGQFWSSLQEFASGQIAELQVVTERLVGDLSLATPMDRRQLYAKARRDEILVLDVRPRDEYEAAHLPYAVSVPLEELKSRLKKLPKSKEIVAYCRGPHCLLAVEAVNMLRRKGFRAMRFESGVQEWRRDGLPLERERMGP